MTWKHVYLDHLAAQALPFTFFYFLSSLISFLMELPYPLLASQISLEAEIADEAKKFL